MTAEQAIDRSISHNEIVHVAFSREIAEELLESSDDHVIAGSVMEFWAVDEEAGEWRVHLDLQGQADVRAAAEVSLGI